MPEMISVGSPGGKTRKWPLEAFSSTNYPSFRNKNDVHGKILAAYASRKE